MIVMLFPRLRVIGCLLPLFLACCHEKRENYAVYSKELSGIVDSLSVTSNPYLCNACLLVAEDSHGMPYLKNPLSFSFLDATTKNFSELKVQQIEDLQKVFKSFLSEGEEKDYPYLRVYDVSEYFLNICLGLAQNGKTKEEISFFLNSGFDYLNSLRWKGTVSLIRITEYCVLWNKYEKSIQQYFPSYGIPTRIAFSIQEFKIMLVSDWYEMYNAIPVGENSPSALELRKEMLGEIAKGLLEMWDDSAVPLENTSFSSYFEQSEKSVNQVSEDLNNYIQNVDAFLDDLRYWSKL